MNKALEHATGDYIVFLNAGDRLHSPDTLQQVFGHIDMNASLPAILYGETDWVDVQGRFIRHRRLQAPKQLTWKKFRHGMLVCHQSFYVRTDLARQELYDLNFRFSADYDWCIRLLKRAERLKQPIYNTRLILTDYLSEGLTTQHHQESLRERFRIMGLTLRLDDYPHPTRLVRYPGRPEKIRIDANLTFYDVFVIVRPGS